MVLGLRVTTELSSWFTASSTIRRLGDFFRSCSNKAGSEGRPASRRAAARGLLPEIHSGPLTASLLLQSLLVVPDCLSTPRSAAALLPARTRMAVEKSFLFLQGQTAACRGR